MDAPAEESKVLGKGATPLNAKPLRVLACVLCQQRKIKCDRRHPCANCLKARVQCVPGVQVARQRKRRFPERELLERLRKYEDLLRKHNIKFEPLHGDPSNTEKDAPDADAESVDLDEETTREGSGDTQDPPTSPAPEKAFDTRSIWHALEEDARDPDTFSDSSEYEIGSELINKAWARLLSEDRHTFFGVSSSTVDLSTFHPEPVQIFRLWQIYLDNVDPMLKVTHTPSLQARIIEAAGRLHNITPEFEALMFGIYGMAIFSLESDECQALFGSGQSELLTRYHFGCQQALLNCGFLKSSDRECLTALFLYLLSLREKTSPHSVSSLLGIAFRLAHRMGIHSERFLASHSVQEAELRRRLWWALVMFDARISEVSHAKTTTLTPNWDCQVPLNVNDSDLQLETKHAPPASSYPTEALYIVVRSKIGDWIRQPVVHQAVKGNQAKPTFEGPQQQRVGSYDADLASLADSIEEKYLKYCNPDIGVQFMTIWMSRALIAKCRLLVHYVSSVNTTVDKAEEKREPSVIQALRMLEADTALQTSPFCKGFRWMIFNYFPFFGYMHLLSGLKRRPLSPYAEQAWDTMGANFEVRIELRMDKNNVLFETFAAAVQQAWEARIAAFQAINKTEGLETPRILVAIYRHLQRLRALREAGDLPEMYAPSLQQPARYHMPSKQKGNEGDKGNMSNAPNTTFTGWGKTATVPDISPDVRATATGPSARPMPAHAFPSTPDFAPETTGFTAGSATGPHMAAGMGGGPDMTPSSSTGYNDQLGNTGFTPEASGPFMDMSSPSGSNLFPNMLAIPGLTSFNTDFSQIDWTTMDWDTFK